MLSQQFSGKRGSLWIGGFHERGKIFFVKFGEIEELERGLLERGLKDQGSLKSVAFLQH